MNLFDEIDPRAATERFDALLERPGLRIERIVSSGQATSPGEWCDQAEDEWVIVIEGSAVLTIEGRGEFMMARGDHVHLPARCRHRVERTEAPTIWIAVHFP